MRYWFNFFIRYSIGYGFFREVISRILAFIRFTLSLATLIFGSILNVKLKPRNFLRQGRSTVDLSRLTFSFNLSSINDVTEFMTRRPARSEDHTSELQTRGHLVCRLLLEKKK